ncbi:MAG: outer membrane protein assembly factor BamE, partial [Chlamydiota bacterium]|nr:outer membrane protein assembly factor BamE [Chlamydiota bacterium]
QWMILWGIFLIMGGCAPHQYMDQAKYEALPLGMSIKEVERRYGSPDIIDVDNHGEITYQYIDRIMMQGELLQQRRYALIIVNGKVVSKGISVESAPNYWEPLHETTPYPN